MVKNNISPNDVSKCIILASDWLNNKTDVNLYLLIYQIFFKVKLLNFEENILDEHIIWSLRN